MSSNQEFYTVVINAEEQYSIWPTFKKVPQGWEEVGFQGIKEVCLAHIQEVWKDMRPLSLRKKMVEHQENWEKQKEALLQTTAQKPVISPTVLFLSEGLHPITTHPTNKSCQELRESIHRSFVHITFLDTQGETCLGMKLDLERSLLGALSQETGLIHLEGTLVLDFVSLRCIADIHLSSLKGNGHLIIS